LSEVLKAMAQGNPISIIPVKSELTTQAAADLLGCSRPHVVKLLENGTIPFTKVGRHRRVLYDDVLAYQKSLKAAQKQALIELMSNDEENGLYDS
jgi:excisionase family DNA binding protein